MLHIANCASALANQPSESSIKKGTSLMQTAFRSGGEVAVIPSLVLRAISRLNAFDHSHRCEVAAHTHIPVRVAAGQVLNASGIHVVVTYEGTTKSSSQPGGKNALSVHVHAYVELAFSDRLKKGFERQKWHQEQ